MGTFFYFAYGSNMLTERLTASTRCPSATCVDIAYAPDHTLTFTKRSIDLSGKATLSRADGSHQHGVLFEVDEKESQRLDDVEGRDYRRVNDFQVVRPDRGEIEAVTYIASNPETGLVPYDWYLALIVAGAKQHDLPAEQIGALLSTDYQYEDKNQRAVNGRRNAMAALAQAGFGSLENILE